MTETLSNALIPAREPLIINALYTRFGSILIAYSETSLIQINGAGDTGYVANEEIELLARPGSDDWIERMVIVQHSMARDLRNERASVQQRMTYLENLGDAILEKAVEHEWCSEYDEFAEEWGLPQRFADYDITVTVRVRAKDEDAAEDLVRSEMGMNEYSEFVVNGPEITSEKAY